MPDETTFRLPMLARALSPQEGSVILSWKPESDEQSQPDDLRAADAGGYVDIQVSREALLDSPESVSAALQEGAFASCGLVVLIPPMGRTPGVVRRHDMSEIASRNFTLALPPHVDAAVVLPRSVLGRPSGSLIEEICSGRQIRTVVDCPGSLLTDEWAPGLSLAVIHLTQPSGGRAAFIELGRGGVSDLDTQLSELWRGRPATDNGFSLDCSAIDVGGGLIREQLNPKRQVELEEAATIGELHRLDELCEVLAGMPRKKETSSGKPSEDALPVLRARYIRRDGIVDDEEPDWVRPGAGPVLTPGDLVLRQLAHPQQPLVSCEVNSEDLPLIAGSNVIVIRPRPHLTAAELKVIRYFVASRRFDTQLRSRQAGSLQLRLSEVASAKVPRPDADFSRAIDAVESAAADFQRWHAMSLDQLNLSFDAPNLEAGRTQLIRNSNQLRQRAAAGRQMDDLEHRVASRYPLPIAYRWRRALAARGSADELTMILHAQEVLLAYLAAISLTLAREEGANLSRMKGIRDRLSEGKSGLGLGQWTELLEEVSTARRFRNITISNPLVDVREFFRDQEVKDAADRLGMLRNFLAHLREFQPGEAAEKCAEARSDLLAMLGAAEFITEYPLIRVTETVWNDIDKRNTIRFRSLVGDSPVVPISEMSSPCENIEAGSLYLSDSRDGLHRLRPLMIGADCQACGHWSTFLVDRYNGRDNVVEYKSLEHGHALIGSESSRSDLVQVGILNQSVLSQRFDAQSIGKHLQLEFEGIEALGQESPEGFVVFAGSDALANPEPLDAVETMQLRGSLMERGVLTEDGANWRFIKDHTFDSRSDAAMVVLGPAGLSQSSWETVDMRPKEAQESSEEGASQDSSTE